MKPTLRNLQRFVSYLLLGSLLVIASLLLVALLYDPHAPNPSPIEPQAVVIAAPEAGLFDAETLERGLVDLLRRLQVELEALIRVLNGSDETPLTAQQPVWKSPPPFHEPGERRQRATLIQL